jgi:hypothetical protein
MNKAKVAGLIIVCATFFLALAVMDYQLMHISGWNADLMYKYWISLGLITGTFAFGLCYLAYTCGLSKRYLPAIFLTVMLLFTAGLLDIFYYLLTFIKGESYSFYVWSMQYKVLVLNGLVSEWTWGHQIIWTTACLIAIFLIWKKTLKK